MINESDCIVHELHDILINESDCIVHELHDIFEQADTMARFDAGKHIVHKC